MYNEANGWIDRQRIEGIESLIDRLGQGRGIERGRETKRDVGK